MMSFKNIFLVVRHVIEKKEKSSKRVRKEFGDCGVGVSVFWVQREDRGRGGELERETWTIRK